MGERGKEWERGGKSEKEEESGEESIKRKIAIKRSKPRLGSMLSSS